MSVPAIAFYASPPAAGVCSPPDFDPNPRSSASASPSTSFGGQKHGAGGLSRIFSSSLPATTVRDELGSSDELAGSYSYSSYLSSSSPLFKCRGRSPVSVFHGPVSSGGSSSRSPPTQWASSNWRAHALRSYVDCDSTSFVVPSSAGSSGRRNELHELPFEFDDGEIEVKDNCEPYARYLLAESQSKHKIFNEEMVVKAFYEAEKAHRGQMRASGDPYLVHCVETAALLANIGANTTIVAAGLLHDTLDDAFVDYDNILGNFGSGVADLVEGVSKLSHLSQLARDNDTAGRNIEADRLHTMFLAMTDARAVLIKLADRLHNMMTLDALPMDKQQRFAKETLEIFVPLASRLGISTWKEQLENLCFKYLQPDLHQSLSFQLLTIFNEALVATAVEKLEKSLKEEGVSYHGLAGRNKSLYSVYSKMLKKKINIDQIHDIHGLRLIVDKEEDCYKALDVVHHLWPKVTGRFKDYISCPKPNGYQSLHTVVLMQDDQPLEIQIRTKEMHLHSEYGFAAHWRYKEGQCEHSSFVLQMVEWARWILTWQCEAMHSELPGSHGDTSITRPPCQFPSHSDDCPYLYMKQCNHSGPTYVVMVENDKMSVEEFLGEPTVRDLMERVGGSSRWPGYNFTTKLELRPRLNNKPVMDPNQKLKMGDVIELTPDLTDESLTEYREEIRRMYDFPVSLSSRDSRRS